MNGPDYKRELLIVLDEIVKQNFKWGYPQLHDISEWMIILVEELGECCKSVLEHKDKDMTDELIQVAAVAINMLHHNFKGNVTNNYISPRK